MRLRVNSSRPWLYAISMIPTCGASRLGSTSLILCFGKPTPGQSDFYGRRLSSAYAVDRFGMRFTCSGRGWSHNQLTYSEMVEYLVNAFTCSHSIITPPERLYFGPLWYIKQVNSAAFRRWYETHCQQT